MDNEVPSTSADSGTTPPVATSNDGLQIDLSSGLSIEYLNNLFDTQAYDKNLVRLGRAVSDFDSVWFGIQPQKVFSYTIRCNLTMTADSTVLLFIMRFM